MRWTGVAASGWPSPTLCIKSARFGRAPSGVCLALQEFCRGVSWALRKSLDPSTRPSKVKMKRSHSPSPTPPAKVQHSSETSDTSCGRRRSLSFDEVFYDELILVIFSYLSAGDLCTIQPTSKNWARLSQDNQVHSNRDVDELDED